AGRRPTWRRCNDSRRNSSRYSLISFFRRARPPLPRCCNIRAPSPSGRQRLRCELSAAGRQRHRIRPVRADDGRQVAGAAQGDCAARQPGRFLFNPATATYFEYYTNPFKAAAASFGVEAIAAPVHDRSELESAFAAQAREPNGSLIVLPDSFLNAHSVEITSLAARYRLPAVYPYRLYIKVGGLLSYGNDVFDNYRRAAGYVDRILKG